MKPRILSTARLSFPLASAIASLLAITCAPAATLNWDGTSSTADADGGNGTWNTSNTTVGLYNSAAAITVNGGGSVTYRPINAGPTFSETIGAVTVNSGQMSFITGTVSSGSATIVMPSITRSTSTSALVFADASGNPITANINRIQVTGSGTTAGWTSGANSNPIIGAWATTGTKTTGVADYAVYNSNNVFFANTIAAAETNWADDTKQYTLANASGTIADGRLTATRSITALRNTTVAAAATTTNGGAAALDYYTLVGNTFANGDAVSVTGTGGTLGGVPYYVVNVGAKGANTFQISTTPNIVTPTLVDLQNTTAGQIAGGVTLSAGNNLGTTGILNSSATSMVIGGSGGAVTLPTTSTGNLFVTAAGAAITVTAPVTDNGAGVLTLVKSGANALTLSGNNTFTGGIVVNAGAVTLSGTNTFATGASGADDISGGSLTYSTLASWGGTGRNVTFNGTGTLTSSVDGYTGGTLTVNSGANALIAPGTTSFATTTGSGNLIFNTGSSKTLNLGNASGFTGTLQARLNNNANYATTTAIQFSSIGDTAGSALQFVGGTSDSTQAMAIALAGDVGPLTFDNRQIQILDRLTSTWEIRANILANNNAAAANKWVINTDLSYTGGRANTGAQSGRIFILSGSNTGDNAFNGVISNGSNTNGLNLSKAGTGKWIVAGANTYTGATTVTAGTLALGASNALGNTAVSIGAATLDAATFTNSVGALNATAAATIHLGGGTLAFAASNGIIWAGTLNLTGTFVSGFSLRFGTTDGGLTSTQLGKITATGFSNFALDASGYLTATVIEGYALWTTGPFLGTLTDPNPAHDFDGGGLSTGIEWATGGDPTHPADDAAKAPTIDNTSDPDYFIFTYRRTTAANTDPNTTIKVEYGSNLSGWTPAVDNGTDIIITPTIDGGGTGVDLVQVKIKRIVAVGGKLFVRLNVVVTTP